MTPLPHRCSALLFHVLFCVTDTSDGLRLSVRPSVCENGVQTQRDAAAALPLVHDN